MALELLPPEFEVATGQDGITVLGVLRYPYRDFLVLCPQPYYVLGAERIYEIKTTNRRFCRHLKVDPKATQAVFSKFPKINSVIRDDITGDLAERYWYKIEEFRCRCGVDKRSEIQNAIDHIALDSFRVIHRYIPEPKTIQLPKTHHDAILKSLGRPFDFHEVKVDEIVYHHCTNQTHDFAHCIDFLNGEDK